MKRILAVLLVATLSLTALPVLAQGDTIVDVAAGNEDFSTLVAAVEAAGLVDTLSSGEYTVFAPRNGAFETLLSEMDMTAEELLADTDLLTSVLTYHVIEGSVTFDDLVALAAQRNDGLVEVETLNGQMLRLSINAEDVTVNVNDGEATVVLADIEASNGIVHVIDNVLVPTMGEMDAEMMSTEEAMATEEMMSTEEMDMDMEATEEATEMMMDIETSLVDVAMSSEDLTTLVAAVEAAELVEALESGEFTVFAPRNGAFETLLTEMDMTAEELLAETELLTDVLTYHVIEGSVTFDDLVALAAERNDGLVEVETLNGATLRLSVDAEEGTVVINDGEASVVQADITDADNGVVHILDNVLLPPADSEMDMDMEATEEMDMDMEATEEAMSATGSIAEIASGSDDFTILTAALDAAGLVETLGEGEYTVFAPTNAAFQNLLSTTGLTADELLSSELLSDILLYHVVEGSVPAETVVTLDGESAETLNGAQVAIAVSEDGAVTLNGVANVTQTDIMATNGVVHVIDEVLLPQAAIEALGL